MAAVLREGGEGFGVGALRQGQTTDETALFTLEDDAESKKDSQEICQGKRIKILRYILTQETGMGIQPKKLVAFFGLNPRVSFSGIGGGTGPLTGLGRGDVRVLRVQGAQSVLRYGQGATHKWAVALKMRRGTNVAVAALARKMVVSIWYLLKGFLVPMKEATPQIVVKMNKIAAEIGRDRLSKMGYESAQAFVEKNIGIVMGAA